MMQAVSKTDIARWVRENEYTYGSLALKPKREDKPQLERKPKKPKHEDKPIPKQRVKMPWYQHTDPNTWFKPIFAALLFMRQRWEAFAMIGVLGVVFGLAWWMTCLWLG